MKCGGVKMIPVQTPAGEFQVWTKKFGNNPDIKILLLHGGPGITHEYLEVFESFFPDAGFEFYYYDQLGSAYSAQPDEPSLWELPRFVDEVEQVRKALGLNSSNFFLYGQSWGGLLAQEYALTHPEQLKGLIISNMVSSVPAYNAFAKTDLMPKMDQAALAEILAFEKNNDTENERYEELLMEHFYQDHVLRIPPEKWPEPLVRAFSKLNKAIYVPMQGPSEMGASGKLENWERTEEMAAVTIPTIFMAARYDTMHPEYVRKLAARMPSAQFCYCDKGSHLAMYDDQESYFSQMITGIQAIAGRG